jgi:hypothetical protein
MWAITLPVAIGSHTILPANLIEHAVLIAAAAATVATYTVVANKPNIRAACLGRGREGEHE